MRRVFLALLATSWVAACGSPTPPSPAVTALALASLAPQAGTIAWLFLPNEGVRLAATATLANGQTQDVSQQSAWRSANTGVATVDSTGLVRGVAPGATDISATYQSQSATIRITVRDLAGTSWMGRASDSRAGGDLRLQFSQQGSAIGGTALYRTFFTVNPPRVLGSPIPGDGTLSGILSGSTLTMTLDMQTLHNLGCPGALAGTATWARAANGSLQLSGQYQGSYCFGAIAEGTFTLALEDG